MHKSLFVLFILCVLPLYLKAQDYKIYLNKDNDIVKDISTASSYVLIDKMDSDSAWAARIYNIQDSIMLTGTYKDVGLKIPHGKFTYYKIYTPLEYNRYNFTTHKYDTTKIPGKNFVSTTGYFVNGIKTGRWIEYNKDGEKVHVNTYVNGKLNGLYQAYNESTGKVMIEGNYVDDLREGGWNQLSYNGDIMETETYKHDKLKNRISYLNDPKFDYKITGGHADYDFCAYLLKKIPRRLFQSSKGVGNYTFQINKEGKLVDPFIARSVGFKTDTLIMEAIVTCPSWKIAYHNDEAIEIGCSVRVDFDQNKITLDNGTQSPIEEEDFKKFRLMEKP